MPFHIFDKMADKLCVRRELLDPNFDGYKLSLDPLPTYTCKFDNGSNTCTTVYECIVICQHWFKIPYVVLNLQLM